MTSLSKEKEQIGGNNNTSSKLKSINLYLYGEGIKTKMISLVSQDQACSIINRQRTSCKKPIIAPANASNSFRQGGILNMKFKTTKNSPVKNMANERTSSGDKPCNHEVIPNQNQKKCGNNISNAIQNNLMPEQKEVADTAADIMKRKMKKKTESKHKMNNLNLTNPVTSQCQITSDANPKPDHSNQYSKINDTKINTNNYISDEKLGTAGVLQEKPSSRGKLSIDNKEEKKVDAPVTLKKEAMLNPSFASNYFNLIMNKITHSTEQRNIFKKTTAANIQNTTKVLSSTIKPTPVVTNKNSREGSKEKKLEKNQHIQKFNNPNINKIGQGIKLQNNNNLQGTIISKQSRLNSVVNSNYGSTSNASNINKSSSDKKFISINVKPKVPENRPHKFTLVTATTNTQKEKGTYGKAEGIMVSNLPSSTISRVCSKSKINVTNNEKCEHVVVKKTEKKTNFFGNEKVNAANLFKKHQNRIISPSSTHFFIPSKPNFLSSQSTMNKHQEKPTQVGMTGYGGSQSNSRFLNTGSRENSKEALQYHSKKVYNPPKERTVAIQATHNNSYEIEKSNSSIKLTIRENNLFQQEAESLSAYIKKYFSLHLEYPPTQLTFYKIGRIIGHGAFGKVNIGLHVLSGRIVAIKSFNKGNQRFSKRKILHEASMMKKFRHRSVVQIYETVETEKYLLMIIEYVRGGDLLSFIKKRTKLNETTSKFIFRQIIEALQHINSHGIVHRDIKLENILIDLNGDVKICDFGVGRTVKKGVVMNDQCGTPAYIAPEILTNQGYEGFTVDVWSAGVVLYTMLSGTVPFKAMNETDLHERILLGKYSTVQDISQEATDLLRGILEIDPKKRLTVDKILNHPWLSIQEDYSVKAKTKITLFTNAERVLLAKSNIDYRTAQSEEIIEMFTLKNLDTLQESENQNVKTKSFILAPFNSTIVQDQNLSLNNSMIDLVIYNDIAKFDGKAKELNRNYELNYNGEIDHGIVIANAIPNQESIHIPNSQVPSKDQNEEDAHLRENSRSNAISRKISQPTSPPELANDGKVPEISAPKEDCHRNARKNMKEMLSTNANTMVFEEKIVKIVEGLGYKRDYLVKSLNSNELNHATATYYLFLNSSFD